jgi:hypothetical protein
VIYTPIADSKVNFDIDLIDSMIADGKAGGVIDLSGIMGVDKRQPVYLPDSSNPPRSPAQMTDNPNTNPAAGAAPATPTIPPATPATTTAEIQAMIDAAVSKAVAASTGTPASVTPYATGTLLVDSTVADRTEEVEAAKKEGMRIGALMARITPTLGEKEKALVPNASIPELVQLGLVALGSEVKIDSKASSDTAEAVYNAVASSIQPPKAESKEKTILAKDLTEKAVDSKESPKEEPADKSASILKDLIERQKAAVSSGK